MNASETEELVRDAMDLIGGPPPAMLHADAPVLNESVVSARSEGMYIIGLIGGKEVGKSALVNALAGSNITLQTSHGPGTEIVIAYAHQTRTEELKTLLEKLVPGKYRIFAHQNAKLARQVLLDLPDIDSRFADHVEITRRMLRHMLYPIWMQSVEKYADVQPQNLLAKVAAGNDPANFLFCLNKVDQLSKPSLSNLGEGLGEGSSRSKGVPAEAVELRDDYAGRIQRALKLPAAPRIYLISAIAPTQFDLPELSRLLSHEKSTQIVQQSRDLAGRQRERSLLAWLAEQDLSSRAASLARLADEASELASQRIGLPLMDVAIPAMLDDSDYRMVMTEGVLATRVARWPMVNIVHALLAPLRLVVRENISTARPGLAGADALVDSHLTPAQGSVASLVQSTFAQLHQSHRDVANLYADRKLWEPMDAELAETRLRADLAATIRRQRDEVMTRLAGRHGIVSPLFRWLLTIGALLWFPLIQPLLKFIVPSDSFLQMFHNIAVHIVDILSADALLKSAAFLLLYYLMLWGWLRYDTKRKVDRLLSRWKTAQQADPSLNLSTQALQWMDDLLDPIRSAHERIDSLVNRIETLRRQVENP